MGSPPRPSCFANSFLVSPITIASSLLTSLVSDLQKSQPNENMRTRSMDWRRRSSHSRKSSKSIVTQSMYSITEHRQVSAWLWLTLSESPPSFHRTGMHMKKGSGTLGVRFGNIGLNQHQGIERQSAKIF